MPPILEGGTALGFTRECTAIPGDMDVDFLVPRSIMEQPGRLEKLQKVMGEAGYDLTTNFGGPGLAGWQLTILAEGRIMYADLLVVDEDYETQGCAKPPCRWTWYLNADGGKEIRRCTTGPFHFQLVAWLGTTFWIPSPVENHLVGEFGYGWVNPKGGVYQACYGTSPQPGKTGTLVANPSTDFRNNIRFRAGEDIVSLQTALEHQYRSTIDEARAWEQKAVMLKDLEAVAFADCISKGTAHDACLPILTSASVVASSGSSSTSIASSYAPVVVSGDMDPSGSFLWNATVTGCDRSAVAKFRAKHRSRIETVRARHGSRDGHTSTTLVTYPQHVYTCQHACAT